MIPIPREWRLEIDIFSPVPAGISTGTSASVCVALLGALSFLAGRKATPDEIAALAHRVETEKLGQQSGIQDQICAAHGGVTFIRMFEYPRAETTGIELEPSIGRSLTGGLAWSTWGSPTTRRRSTKRSSPGSKKEARSSAGSRR